jgi:hypothetical protein
MRRVLLPVAAAAMIMLTAGCNPIESTEPSRSAGAPASDGPTAPPDATETLSSTEIPETALLTAEDVGPGYTAGPWEIMLTDHGSLTMLMWHCGEGRYSEASEHTIAALAGGAGRSEQEYVHVLLTRYEAGWAESHLSDLVSVLPRCARISLGGGVVVTLSVVDSDFAGDGSLLVREEDGDETQYHALVRQGDVQALLRIHTGGDESQPRSIATAAAVRLCEAVDTC